MNKTIKLLWALFAAALLLTACNKGPGEGGTGTVRGYVKLVHHPDDDYTLTPDTMAAAKTDVFLVYGDQAYFGDDVETGPDGMYQFEYLLPGEYTVFSYSTLPSGEKVAESTTVSLARGAVQQVPTIYIHDGKAYGSLTYTLYLLQNRLRSSSAKELIKLIETQLNKLVRRPQTPQLEGSEACKKATIL